MGTQDVYRALADGDPEAVQRFAPRVASLAAAARKARASALPSPAPRAPQAPLPAASTGSRRLPASSAAPARIDRPSRAAEVAAVHGDAINASRKRAGLPPLSAAELEREFVEVDQLPPARGKVSRRDRGNAMAAQMGVPALQQGIDDMHAGIVAKLNATPPSRQGPDEGRRASPGVKQTQAEVDDMWTSLVNDHNRQAGLKTPSRAR
jgi:hypothetical protein